MHAIVLAHEESFDLGPMTVHPATRSVSREGRSEVLEPRVMQVLVALGRHPGEVVSRDDLVEACWEGRVVGDDAVNRVIGRLRRTAEGIASGVFAVDTITRVGFRLRLLGGKEQAAKPAGPASKSRGVSRRNLVLAAGGVAVAVAGGSLLTRRRAVPRVSAETEALLQQAKVAQWQNTREGQNQAIGLYRQIVASQPDFADAWGLLAMTYGWTAHYRQSSEAAMLQDRARAAARRALALQGDNPLGRAGLATARPMVGNWHIIEPELRAAATARPAEANLAFSLAMLLGAVGRWRESLAHLNFDAGVGPTPALFYYRAQLLWASQRIEEMDDVLATARRVYPTHYALWFGRFYGFLFTGRPQEALALAADTSNFPTGIDEQEISSVARVARVVANPGDPSRDAVAEEWKRRARQGAGHAENAAQFLAALGFIDDAFAMLHAYYFSEGFDCGELRFTREQGTYTPRNDRLTFFLLAPGLAALRRDPRFGEIITRLGLDRFWRASGKQPDFLLGGAG